MQLSHIGLDEKESKVYISALKLGSAKANQIAKLSGVERSYCYLILDHLGKLGLVSKEEVSGRVAVFVAKHPSKVSDIAKNNLEKALSVVGELESIYKDNNALPSIERYEGKDGILEIYKIAQECQSKKVLGIVNPTSMGDALGQDRTNSIIEEFSKCEVQVCDLIVRSGKSKEFTQKAKEFDQENERFLPRGVWFETDFLIFDDCLAMISFSDPMYGYIIKSKQISDSWKEIHRVLWNISR